MLQTNPQIIERKTLLDKKKVRMDECKLKLSNDNIVTWQICVFPDILFAVPVRDDMIWMVKEWRLGPQKVMTQFTGARCIHKSFEENLEELARELQEEQGIIKPKFEILIETEQGSHIQGKITHVLVTDFEIDKVNRDQNEIIDTIQLPIYNLYRQLSQAHVTTAGTLLVAKILEEKYKK